MKALKLLVCFLILRTNANGQETLSDAQGLVDAKDYMGARAMLERIVDRDGGNNQARFMLGRLMAGPLREYDDAEEQLEKAVALAPDSAEYHFWLGQVYGIQAQLASIFSKLSYARKVKSEFEKASELDPRTVRYRIALMRYYIRAPGIVGGSNEKAREQAAQIEKLEPYEGLLAIAEVEIGTGDNEKGEQAYHRAIALRPGEWRGYHLLGYYYMRAERWDDAIAQFKSYVAVAPKDANSHDSLGEALLAKGRIDESLACYLKALSIDGSFASSLYGTAKCYDRKGMKAEASLYYRQYADSNPSSSEAQQARERAKELDGK